MTLPTAPLTPAPLIDQPATDKAFTHDGTTYRVRVLKVGEAAVQASTSGDAVAPFTQAFDITVTRLDQAGEVVRDADGRVVIVANTRWTVDAETFGSGGKAPEEALDMLIGNLIWKASAVGQTAVELSNLMAGWGGA